MFATNLNAADKRALIESLSEYVKRIAGNPSVPIFEAEILWLNDKQGEAEALLRSVAGGNDPASAALAHVCLGGILADRGQDAEALEALHAASRVESSAFMAHWKAGQLQKQRGETAAALESFRNAAASEAVEELVEPFASEYLALVTAAEGTPAAAAELRALLERHPSNAALRRLAADHQW